MRQRLGAGRLAAARRVHDKLRERVAAAAVGLGAVGGGGALANRLHEEMIRVELSEIVEAQR